MLLTSCNLADAEVEHRSEVGLIRDFKEVSPMKKLLFAMFSGVVLLGMAAPAQAQHRHRHCYYKHHHRHCEYR
jgi:hypothetical protein